MNLEMTLAYETHLESLLTEISPLLRIIYDKFVVLLRLSIAT